MSEITGVWMNRDHTRVAIERSAGWPLLIIDVNTEQITTAASQAELVDDRGWDELYPETDFS